MITAKAAGTAVVTVTTADGGKTATCNVTVSSATDAEDLVVRLATIYPNPNDGKFTLNFENQETYQIAIANMAGKVFFRTTVSDMIHEIDISAQPAGIFLVMVENGKRRTTIKVVKH